MCLCCTVTRQHVRQWLYVAIVVNEYINQVVHMWQCCMATVLEGGGVFRFFVGMEKGVG